MKALLALTTVLAVALRLPAQSEDPGAIMKSRLQATQDIAALLRDIKDQPSAQAALAPLDAPVKEFLRAQNALEKLAKKQPQLIAKLEDDHDKAMSYAGDLRDAELKRLRKEPELFKICCSNTAFKEAFYRLDDAVADCLRSVQGLTAILRGIKDVASAEAATRELQGPADEWLPVAVALHRLQNKVPGPGQLPTKRDKALAYAFDLLAAEVKRLDSEPPLFATCTQSKPFREMFGEATSPEGKLAKALVDVKILEQAVAAYRVSHDGRVPSYLWQLTQEQVNGVPPLVAKQRLVDPWGKPYVYDVSKRSPPPGTLPLIMSKGPPGQNLSIRNWQ
jgi:hypothetical protein